MTHGLSPHTLALLGACKEQLVDSEGVLYPWTCDLPAKVCDSFVSWVDAGCPDFPTEPDLPQVALNGHHFAQGNTFCSAPKCEARRDDPSGECPRCK